jgi:hypothetical protein
MPHQQNQPLHLGAFLNGKLVLQVGAHPMLVIGIYVIEFPEQADVPLHKIWLKPSPAAALTEAISNGALYQEVLPRNWPRRRGGYAPTHPLRLKHLCSSER